ncbi:hypothetical protein FSP39_021983 [Pinctada imbricata]|uniref:DNA-directed DNA polymerase n=1 Tax=Pinctada imbricata TaxID=66713 RepID=A0AA88YMC2_PINIB|nr:hypothetical protein FSP39_021983 [Pinctada imbricata]
MMLNDDTSLYICRKDSPTEQQLFREIEEMEWEDVSNQNIADDIIEQCIQFQDVDFGNQQESSFHEGESLLADTSRECMFDMEKAEEVDFFDIVDGSFHRDDSLLSNIDTSSFPMIQIGRGPKREYDIRLVKEKALKKMGATDVSYELTFNDSMFKEKKQMKDVLQTLRKAFKDMIDKVKQDLQPGDIMRGVVHNDALDVPIFVPFRPMEDMNADAMLDAVINVLNSEETIPFDSSCRVDIGAIKYPRGGRRTRIVNIASSTASKTSIVTIRNSDNLCLLRASIVAYASLCKTREVQCNRPSMTEQEILLRNGRCSFEYYEKLRKNRTHKQDEVVLVMSQDLNIEGTLPLTYKVIPQLENYLNVNIYVVCSSLGNEFSYISSGTDTERKNIFLYHVKDEDDNTGHFHAIVNIAGFFGRSYFCSTCLKSYNSKMTHRCLTHCDVCFTDPCIKDQEIYCVDCNRTCRSSNCYKRHKTKSEKGTMPCQFFYKCPTCFKTIKTTQLDPKDHKCGYYTCSSCQQYVDPTHLCYAKSQPSQNLTNRRYIFADIEASQKDEMLQCEWGYVPRQTENCEACQQIKNDLCSTCKYASQSTDNCRDCNFRRSKKCPSCCMCRNCGKSACGKMKHIVVLAVCQTACKLCEHKDVLSNSKCSGCGHRCSLCSKVDAKTKQFKQSPCETCGHREKVFHSLYELGAWMFDENHKGFTVIFHNLSYDGQFLLQYLLSQSIKPSFVIYRGSKIQMFNVPGVSMRVIDSFNFLPMALAKLPKAFQLESLAKGYFPHFFTCRENLNYVGPYPPVETYGPNAMSTDERKKFLTWYHSKIENNELFNFQAEMIKYCKSDVDILRRACLKFKTLVMDVTQQDGGVGIDAFASTTIASLCMEVFKSKFLREEWKVLVGTPVAPNEATNNACQRKDEKEKWLDAVKINGKLTIFHDGNWKTAQVLKSTTRLEIKKTVFVKSPIARPPPNGYTSMTRFSKKSIQWLEWVMYRKRIKGQTLEIQHALNGRGEYRVPGTKYSLDGYAPGTAKHPGGVAYEFHGCRYHGCPYCFKRKDDVPNPITGHTALELLNMTRVKEETLRSLGIKVVTIWECQFDYVLKKNPIARAFVDTLDLVDRLEPRDSLMGGRTNGSVLYKKATRGTKIKYVDFTSLYPFVNKTCRYPIGHPVIITRDFQDLSHYFGLAKVKVLPPRGLFHPVLGYRTGGKLTFPLCRFCVEHQQQTPCICTNEARSFVGTFCTPEIQMAVEKGYQIMKTYEVYHWSETTEYDPDSKEGGLFANYINMFLKIKQEASGRPEWVKTESDLEKYIEMYEKREGIRLDPNHVDFNSGMRSLAKLLLNSFWGKFGQRMNLSKTEFIHDSQAYKLFDKMTDPTIEIIDFNIINEETLMLSTKRSSESLCDPGHTNVFLASFTTCWARLKLYSLLDLLQTRALYWDTDSVIYSQKEGEPEPPVGDYLGELTDELGGVEEWIETLIVCGPKNYAYRTNRDKEVCKVKGFSLNYGNSQILNFESMQDAVLNRNDPFTGLYALHNPNKICRQKLTSDLYSQEEIKQYACVYTKRVVLDNLSTIPYGY